MHLLVLRFEFSVLKINTLLWETVAKQPLRMQSRRTTWKLGWDACVNGRRAASWTCPSGFMMLGNRVTICLWPWTMRNRVSTRNSVFHVFSRQGAFIHVHVDVKQSSMPLPGSSFWWGHILTGAVHQAMWEDHHGDREAIEYDRCGLVLKGRHANRSEVEYESWIIIIWFLFKPANLLTWNRRPFASFCNKFPC